jgi:hypothetical protein
MDAVRQSLASLGLTTYEAGAYLALLGRPDLTPAEVAGRAGIPRQRVYDVLGSLTAKGLCAVRDAGAKSYAAVEPGQALDLLARERGEALLRQREETQALAARLAEDLGPVFAASRGQNDPLAYVEVLSGPTRIAHRALALAQAATRSVHSCIKEPLILSLEQNQAFMRAPLARGLAYRALCDAALLERAPLRQFLGELVREGLEARLAPVLPLKLQAFDDEVALLSMQDPAGGPPSFTAVVIHNRGVVSMLNLAFEHLWAAAKPFTE